jgi:dUTP pyrophosphatase
MKTIPEFMEEMKDKKHFLDKHRNLTNVNKMDHEYRYTTQQFPMNYKRFDTTLPALFKEDEGNAGFDLFARLDGPVVLVPGETAKIPLNVATEVPIFGVGLLFHRSSTFSKWGVRLTNNVGVIDSLFSGDGDEWKAEFMNVVDRTITINPGDKICQALFLPLLPVVPVEKNVLDNEDRGGFGTSFDNASNIKED